MEEKYLKHVREVRVSLNDADFTERLKPSAVMEYFQDIATEHAVMLGVGYEDMRANGLIWVAIRMSFKAFKSPAIDERLTVVTYPEKPQRVEADRGYYIYDKNGEVVALGTTKWCVLDNTAHKIQRCAPLFPFGDSAYIPRPPFEDANPKIAPIMESDAAEGPFAYEVRLTDLDRNFHMNNTRYGDVILNTCGIEQLRNGRIARVDINFLSELFFQDRYEVFKAQRGTLTVIEARKAGSGAPVFRAQVEWEPV